MSFTAATAVVCLMSHGTVVFELQKDRAVDVAVILSESRISQFLAGELSEEGLCAAIANAALYTGVGVEVHGQWPILGLPERPIVFDMVQGRVEVYNYNYNRPNPPLGWFLFEQLNGMPAEEIRLNMGVWRTP